MTLTTDCVLCRRLVRDISEDTTRNVTDVSMGEGRSEDGGERRDETAI